MRAQHMNFVESRLLGIQIDETGRHVVLSFIDTACAKFSFELNDVERLLINEVRQQNVMEGMTHWTQRAPSEGLREAAFALMTGATEKDCAPALVAVALNVVDRVVSGEISILETRAVFGAMILASFGSMSLRDV